MVFSLGVGLPLGSVAQTATPPIRQADFIVAVVNSEPITNQEVRTISQRLLRESIAQGRALDESQANNVALEQLINDKAQLQQARDLGLRIDAEALTEAELGVARNNQLSLEALHQRLQQEGLPLAIFREQLRNQLLLTRLREREVESRIRISETEISQLLQQQLQSQASRAPMNLNLAMILVAVPENSNELQIQALAARAQDIVRRARSGEDFVSLAKTFSQTTDQGANGGAMGLRPADRYPELFLQATQMLSVGDVSEVVRSGAGFHVLKVLQREQTPATLMLTQTRARHILLRPGQTLTQSQAIAQLAALRQDIVAGKVDFADVARRLSQDGSAPQGGDLGWANPGMFVPEFEQAMNGLRPGQVATPLVSRFGVHLIEVTDRREVPMSNEQQRTLARNLLREKKLEEAYDLWAEDLRARAYVEMPEAPL